MGICNFCGKDSKEGQNIVTVEEGIEGSDDFQIIAGYHRFCWDIIKSAATKYLEEHLYKGIPFKED